MGSSARAVFLDLRTHPCSMGLLQMGPWMLWLVVLGVRWREEDSRGRALLHALLVGPMAVSWCIGEQAEISSLQLLGPCKLQLFLDQLSPLQHCWLSLIRSEMYERIS